MNWYVLRCKPRCEMIVEYELLKKNFEVYVTWVNCFKICKKVKIKTKKALITNYIFVKANSKQLFDLQYTIGSIGFLKHNYCEVFVNDECIENLKKVCLLKNPPEVVQEFRVGDKILIQSGVLKGVCGIVYSESKNDFLYIESGINGMKIKVKFSDILVQ